MKSPRDSQRKRVYVADAALDPFAKPLPTVPDIEAFVKRVWGMKRLAKKYPGAFRQGWSLPYVKDGRRQRRATATASGIRMPRWSRNEGIACHELAHVVASRHYGDDLAAPHGWQYCAIYLDLVRWTLGKAAHDALKAAFKANKVRFRKPVAKRVLTPEQRAVLVERMSAARALRKAA